MVVSKKMSKLNAEQETMQTVTEEPKEMRRIPMCKEHTEEDLRFYCLICEDTICRDCKIISHDSHKADLVSNVAKEMRQTLANLLETTECVISKFKEKDEDVSEKGNNESPKSDKISEVSRIASLTKFEIDKLVETIEGEIKSHAVGKTKKEALLELTTLKESINQAMEGDYQVVSSYKQLTECCEKLVGRKREERLSMETKCEEMLLAEFTKLSEKTMDGIRKFDVSRYTAFLNSKTQGVSVHLHVFLSFLLRDTFSVCVSLRQNPSRMGLHFFVAAIHQSQCSLYLLL